MRILFTVYDRAHYTGGPIVNARRLLPEWVRRGHTVKCLVAYHEAHASADAMREAGVEVSLFDQEAVGWACEPLCEWILREAAAWDPDVFVPNSSAPAAYAARWIRESGRPTVICHRSPDTYNRALAERFAARKGRWRCSGIVAVNPSLLEAFPGMELPSAVIPSGVPVPAESADPLAACRLVYAGRFETPEKRILDIFDALHRALDRHAALEVTFLGSGSEESTLRARIAVSPHAARIRLLAPLGGEAYAAELRRHQGIVLLSEFEGTPGSLMDGMANGLVPITHAMPGIGFLVRDGDNGWVAKDREADFDRAVDAFVTQPHERARRARAAKDTILRSFSLETAAEQWELFLSLLHSHAGERKPIRIPKRLHLPPPWPGFGTEDLRRDPVAWFGRWAARFSRVMPT